MAELWPFVHRYVKKKDGGIVLVLFQSEASISECDKVWDHLKQNSMVSKMVFAIFRYVALTVFVL